MGGVFARLAIHEHFFDGENPGEELLSIWNLGAWPIGVDRGGNYVQPHFWVYTPVAGFWASANVA